MNALVNLLSQFGAAQQGGSANGLLALLGGAEGAAGQAAGNVTNVPASLLGGEFSSILQSTQQQLTQGYAPDGTLAANTLTQNTALLGDGEGSLPLNLPNPNVAVEVPTLSPTSPQPQLEASPESTLPQLPNTVLPENGVTLQSDAPQAPQSPQTPLVERNTVFSTLTRSDKKAVENLIPEVRTLTAPELVAKVETLLEDDSITLTAPQKSALLRTVERAVVEVAQQPITPQNVANSDIKTIAQDTINTQQTNQDANRAQQTVEITKQQPQEIAAREFVRPDSPANTNNPIASQQQSQQQPVLNVNDTRANANQNVNPVLADSTLQNTNVQPVLPNQNAAAVLNQPGEVLNFERARPDTPQTPTQQVEVKLQQALQTGEKQISIRLVPAELGRVDIRIDVSADNRASLVIATDSKDTLDLLQRDVRGLERALNDSGLKTDSGALEFQLRGENQQQFAKQYQDIQHQTGKSLEVDPMDGFAGDVVSYQLSSHNGLLDIQA